MENPSVRKCSSNHNVHVANTVQAPNTTTPPIVVRHIGSQEAVKHQGEGKCYVAGIFRPHLPTNLFKTCSSTVWLLAHLGVVCYSHVPFPSIKPRHTLIAIRESKVHD